MNLLNQNCDQKKILLSDRIANLPTSKIAAISAIAQKMKADGLPLINLAMGNPSHAIPDIVQKAMIKEIQSGQVPYGTPAGIDELREAVAAYTNRNYDGSDFNKENVVITAGSALATYIAQSIVIENVDKSLIMAPAYSSYAPAIALSGGEALFAIADRYNGFQPNLSHIEKCFSDNINDSGVGTKIRSIILNYPNNPTGAVLSETQAKALADCLNKMGEKYWGDRGFIIILDDVYSEIYFGKNKSHSIYPYLSEHLKANTIILGSASKTSALAGERIGYAVGEKSLINKMIQLNSGIMLNAGTIAQAGLLADLQARREMGQDEATKLREYYGLKSKFVTDSLNEISREAHWPVTKKPVPVAPEGSIFVMANLSGMIGRKIPEELQGHDRVGKETIETDEDIAKYLMCMAHTKDKNNQPRHGVAVVPGSGFFMDPKAGYVRICISGTTNTPMEKDIMLKQAMESIRSAALMQLPEILRGNGDARPPAINSKTVTTATVYK